LTDFDRDNLPERVVRQLQRVMADPQFTPEQVRALAPEYDLFLLQLGCG
jgi:hypothetical protein